jgi:hypothetical protein
MACLYHRVRFSADIRIRRQRAMPEPHTAPRWTRHLVYRSERTRTTWKLRLALLAVVVLALWLTSAWWTVAVGGSLVCDSSLAKSDAIVIENFDPDYQLFWHAAQLRRAGLASRVLVPVWTSSATRDQTDAALGIAQVMARLSRIGEIEIVATRDVEPITLNTARDVQRFLEREHIRSVIVVTPLFRSRRSALIYGATLGRAGITVHCEPVQVNLGVKTWTQTWHGVQDVAAQWLKLQYYRLYVLPFLTGEE